MYGAGTAPAITSRCYKRIADAPFMIYCQYPIFDIDSDSANQICSFTARGDSRLAFKMRLIPANDHSLHDYAVKLIELDTIVDGHSTKEGHREYEIPGGSRVEIRWKQQPH